MCLRHKFTLADKNIHYVKKVYSAKNYKRLFTSLIFLMILLNVESKSHHQNQLWQNATVIIGTQTIISTAEKPTNTLDCSLKSCVVHCSGDMTNLNWYLETLKTCQSYALKISNSVFPDDRLQSDWLKGNFRLNLIEIKTTPLGGIDDGAFNHTTVAEVTDIEFNGVQLPDLTAETFVGLKSVENFVLINRIKVFSGDGFLTPMAQTLKKVTIKHVTNVATDPAPWLRGGDYPKLMTIVFDGSNFGEFINTTTFEHLNAVFIIMMNSCKISHIADGAFDFLSKKFIFHLGLASNQLKRISGEYLAKVTSLKVVDLQYNPWDCTCELEGFIRDYSKYPDAFGYNVKCRTPAEVAGKRLNEVYVEPCVNTTPVSTATYSSTPADAPTQPSPTSSSSTEE